MKRLWGKGRALLFIWQLCVKMSLIMGLLGLKCMLKSIGVAWLYYVEGV